jgi:hypothetical protein
MPLHYSSVRFNHHPFAADLHEEHPVPCSWITTAFVPDPRALAVHPTSVRFTYLSLELAVQ